MKLERIKEILAAEIVIGETFIGREVRTACGCDLMSHVLAHVNRDNTLLLTGLTTPQVIYTADAVDVKAICFVRGKRPEAETVRLAQERGMVLLQTELPLFESCGKLYQAGLRGCSEDDR